MRLHSAAALICTIVLAVGNQASAGLIPMPVTTLADFNTLLGGVPTALGVPQPTSMISLDNKLQAQVLSQAFELNSKYLYLYQINNLGSTGNSYIETFTISPMLGATSGTQVGYLGSNAPTGFSLGYQAPAGASLDSASGPTLSFSFPGYLGNAIEPGKSSKALYVLIDKQPGQATGNVINGTIASGEVTAPVPEPATLSLLSVGGLFLLAYAWRRQRGS